MAESREGNTERKGDGRSAGCLAVCAVRKDNVNIIYVLLIYNVFSCELSVHICLVYQLIMSVQPTSHCRADLSRRSSQVKVEKSVALTPKLSMTNCNEINIYAYAHSKQ